MYVYIRSEKTSEGSLWTVGFYGRSGAWHAESDHDDKESAAARVSYLNGGTKEMVEIIEATPKDTFQEDVEAILKQHKLIH